MIYLELYTVLISADSRRRDRDVKCCHSCARLLQGAFVWLDAACRIPALVAGTWVVAHVVAMAQTTLIAVNGDILHQTIQWSEIWTYVQAAGIVAGEVKQIYDEVIDTEFLDEGRAFSHVPYHTLWFARWMIEPRGTVEWWGGKALWASMPLWGSLLWLILAVANGGAVTSGAAVSTLAGAVAAWLLAGTQSSAQWYLSVAATMLAAFMVVLILKLWAYGGLKMTPSDFRANLTLRVRQGADKKALQAELESLWCRDELENDRKATKLGQLLIDIEKHLGKQELAVGVWKSHVGQRNKGEAQEQERGEAGACCGRRCDPEKSKRRESAVFTPPFGCRSTRCAPDFQFKDSQGGAFCLVTVGMIVGVKPTKFNADEDGKSH